MKTPLTMVVAVLLSLSLYASANVHAQEAPDATVRGTVFLDANGNGLRDDGENLAIGAHMRVRQDGRSTRSSPLESHEVVTDDAGNFVVSGLYPDNIQRWWTTCGDEEFHWWITPANTNADGCARTPLTSGENAYTIGIQSVDEQRSAAASVAGYGFADHDRNGAQDLGDTAMTATMRLILTGPTQNDNRSGFKDTSGVMRWGGVFAPAGGYGWDVCLENPQRFEITSVAPGGSPADDGCWHITISPGDNTLVFGFYDRQQPGGTPTPTMTPTPAPTPVPLGMRLVLDCDPSQDGVQSACDATLGQTSNVDVDVLLVNDSAGDRVMAAVGAGIRTDRSRLFPPPYPEAGGVSNPDVNPEFVAQGMSCFDPPPRNENPGSGDGISSFGCYTGDPKIAIAAGSTTWLATIHYVVVEGVAPGGVELEFVGGDFSHAEFTDWLCPGDGAVLVMSACTGATIRLVAAATATPSPTATATSVQNAHAQATSTPHASQVNAVAPSARVVRQVNAVVAPVASTPRVGVLGASVQPPNTGEGFGTTGGGGTWLPMALLLLLSGGGVLAAVYARAVRR